MFARKQPMEGSMGLRINDTAPDFTAESNEGTIHFHDWIGDGWAVLFSHPKDFTPVCTTEFGAVARLGAEWAQRNAKVIGVSVDGVEDHVRWIGDIQAVSGARVGFPIIADKDLKVSKAYDMLPADAYLPDGRTPAHTQTVRSVYIIGPDKKVKLVLTYPMSVGRNFAEILRALDALQKTYEVPLSTPADWQVGQDVIVATSLNDEQAQQKYGPIDKKLPYLRYVKA
jgi:alkyl hydroperoxide reductase subunit AhpC